MNTYLFSIGLGVQNVPERWTAICGIYALLARGLTRLGHRCFFLVNPKAFDVNALRGFEVFLSDHEDLQKQIEKNRPDFCFVWGGRIEPDRKTVSILSQNEIRPVFSELGWFPQKGTIYFDLSGTNSEMSVARPQPMSDWASFVFGIKRARACRRIYGRSVQSTAFNSPARRVFVPLQDETDTNITQDSPFSHMDEMLGFLSHQYPDCQFVTRIHPKAPPAYLGAYPNVEVQPPEVNLYKSLPEFDLVIGINSTVLSEAVFLGHPAVCFGDGVATRHGLAARIDPQDPPQALVSSTENYEMRNALAHLFLRKQLEQKKLSSPRYLERSYLRELLAL